MVARVKIGHSIRRALNYNEYKVLEDSAVLFHASGYLIDTSDLGFYAKLYRLEDLARQREDVEANSVHISLNFDPSETLDQTTLAAIADDYMEGIGLGAQPYLVYQHFDAGHPHIHIVTTNIQPGGRRIDLHNVGRFASEQARKEIEKKYGLVEAESRAIREAMTIRPVKISAIHYGKGETKRAITNVLDQVLGTWSFTSLPELNAVLRVFNLMADPGQPGGRIHRQRGLNYQVLREDGTPIGKKIKASSIYSKPTLATLEEKFSANKAKASRRRSTRAIRSKIDWVLTGSPPRIEDLREDLKDEGIDLVVWQNKQGFIYGMTFIDEKLKTVASGSDLGKGYTARSILAKCGIENWPARTAAAETTPTMRGLTREETLLAGLSEKEKTLAASLATPAPIAPGPDDQASEQSLASEIGEILVRQEPGTNQAPREFKRKRRGLGQ